jgi:precorrin-6x reductase
MYKFLVFGGTTEGREITEKLSMYDVEIYACVATEYGKELLPKSEGITILAKRLDVEQMEQLMLINKFNCVIDATHPYAIEVTKNIKNACLNTNTEYLRLVRSSSQLDNCIYLDDLDTVVEYLNTVEGNILLTTGSKELEMFTKVKDFNVRIFPRVLPITSVIQKCIDLGFKGKNLICMQGPFSKEFNYAMIKEIEAKVLVTKDSGDIGGVLDKIKACNQAHINAIVVGRPTKESGYQFNEIMNVLNKRYNLKYKYLMGKDIK